MSEESSLTTFFLMWSNDALKHFLKGKGLKITGNKDTLAARAFAAWEFGVPDLQDKKTIEFQNIKDYEELLKINEILNIPDPLGIKDG